MANITLLPSAKVPLVYDGENTMTTEWYRFFWNIYGFTGTGVIPVDKGGTGLNTIGDHQLIIGNANNVFEPALLSSASIAITYPAGFINLELGTSGVTPGTYGSASQVGVFTVNAYGVLTAASNTSIGIDASQIISGQLPILYGGTGASTAAGARANLSAAILGANNDITSMTAITGGISSPDFVQFDIAPTTIPTAEGALYWDSADSAKTLSLVMTGGNAIQQIGEEQYFRIKASSAITEGQVVMFTGAVGASGGLTGAPATGLTASTAQYVMGVATENIANNGWGYVTSFGTVRGINTTGGAEAWVDGEILYLNPAVAGGLTKTVPAAPNPKVVVAAVTHAASNGSLFIRPSFGGILGQYEGDVQVTTPANGDLLIRNQTAGKWVNAPLTAGSGVTISNTAGAVTISATGSGGTVTSVSGTGTVNGITLTGTVTSSGSLTLGGTLSGIGNSQLTNSTISGVALGGNLFNLTAGTGVSFSAGTTYNGSAAITINATGTGGTVTSVAALTLGTTGTDLSSTVANSTTTPVITLNVPTASAANRGALSSTDWSTFNGKQAALVSGTNIKTVGGVSLLGAGDVGTIGVGYGGTGTATAFTAGSVVFAGASGVYTQDNANFFWDDTNNRLGLGITTPAYPLHIVNSASWQGVFASVADGGARAIMFKSNQVSTTKTNWMVGAQYNVNDGFEITPSTAAGGTTFSTPALAITPAGQIKFNNLNTFWATGGVSIGNITDPGATNLSVTGTGLFGGNVGGGTTSPTGRISAYMTDTATYATTILNTDATVDRVNAANTNNQTAMLRLRASSNTGTVSGIGAIAIVQPNWTANSGDMVFLLNRSGGVNERFKLDNAGNAYVEGGALWQYAPAPTAKAAAATLTAAELITGIISTTGTTYTVTLPTGTDIDTAFPSVPTTNIGFDFIVVNTASGTITIAVGASGMTSLGTLTVLTGISARFRLRRTATNTYVLYRIG